MLTEAIIKKNLAEVVDIPSKQEKN